MDNIRTKFFTTTSDKLHTIAVANGQVIALSDKDAWYYDMGGTRHAIVSNVFVESLPATGDANTFYALNGTAETSGIYIWVENQFKKLCDLDGEKVKTSLVDTGKMYLTFVAESTDGSHELKKNVNIYIDVQTREANIVASEAKKATNDGDGNEIKSTYVKNVDASRSGTTTTVTVTKGDDSTSTFDVEDTTYGNFKGATDSANGEAGLVPSPAIADKEKFLRADGSWANPVNTEYGEMSGASASAAGSSGLVPKPEIGDNQKYLRGDGTWAVTPNDNTEYDPMIGATSSAAGAEGLVPAPSAGDQDKFLKGDGSWSEVETTDTKNTVGATASTDKLFIVGAPSQSAESQSYTNDRAYVNGGKVYSDGVEVVNLSGSQALTGKTYEGYTLGDASAKGVVTSKDDIAASNTNLPTAGAVHGALQDILTAAQNYTNTEIGKVVQFKIEVVDTLPGTGVANTIYLVPSEKVGTQNIKTEYMWINSAWEIIGSTEIDLAPYAKTEDLHSVAISGNYSELNGLPTIPVAATTAPQMDGTAAVGSDASGFAKGDHVHPTDTSRAPAIHGHDNFVGSGANAAAGFVPAPPSTAGTDKYLREDGSWVAPPNTEYTHPAFTAQADGVTAAQTPAFGDTFNVEHIERDAEGHVSSKSTKTVKVPDTAFSSDKAGLVPAGGTGATKFLRQDGTWVVPTDTVYDHPTGDGNLHVPATGTTNNKKVLTAGSTAGSLSWSKVSYNDLEDKPTIPAAANNGTLTIKVNNANAKTFSADQASNVEVNITVPTKISDLTNDGIRFTDATTGTIYKLGVNNGALYIEAV